MQLGLACKDMAMFKKMCVAFGRHSFSVRHPGYTLGGPGGGGHWHMRGFLYNTTGQNGVRK